MGSELVSQIGVDALKTVLMVAMPLLVLALTVGLIVSVFQSVTQIQEMTLTFVPKILALLGGLYVFSGYMLDRLMGFFFEVIRIIPNVVR